MFQSKPIEEMTVQELEAYLQDRKYGGKGAPTVTNNPIKDTITECGFPTLVVYLTPVSKFWQMRAYMGGKIVKRTTKTEDKAQAIKAAKAFYLDLAVKAAAGQPVTQAQGNFMEAANALIKSDQLRVERGDLKASAVSDLEYILEKDLQPHFGAMNLRNITTETVEDYYKRLQDRGCSAGTIQKHRMHLSKVFTKAEDMKLVDRKPKLPKVGKGNASQIREWINDEQYESLMQAINKAITEKIKVRYQVITEHLRDLTNFMLGSYLRVSDIKNLKNKDVAIITKGGKRYLKIIARSKVKAEYSVSLPSLVPMYEQRLKGAPDDFVFFPQFKGRGHAMTIMACQFAHVLEMAGLKSGDHGGKRDLTSLRHTCIMRAYIAGAAPQWIATNARTSVAIIEAHYGSHFRAEMGIAQVPEYQETGAQLPAELFA